MLIPLGLLIQRSPEDVGLLPDGGVVSPAGGEGVPAPRRARERDFTLKEARRSTTLWLLIAAMSISQFATSGQAPSMVPFFRSIGFSSTVAATGLAVYGVFSGLSRFLWGRVADRYTVRVALLFQAVLTAVGLGLYLQIATPLMLYAASVYQGLMLGGIVVLQPMVWAAYFGRAHVGAITGFALLFSTSALAVGPLFASCTYDRTGTYAVVYAVLMAGWLASAAILRVTKPMARNDGDDTPEGAPSGASGVARR